MEFYDLRGEIGRVRNDGSVYSMWGQRYGTQEAIGGKISVPGGVTPAYVFSVRSDGQVYGHGLLGSKKVGTVEGTSDLVTIGGLALIVLWSTPSKAL
jgi:hypothetical protein